MVQKKNTDVHMKRAFEIERKSLNRTISDIGIEFAFPEIADSVAVNFDEIAADISLENEYIAKIFLTTVVFSCYILNKNEKGVCVPVHVTEAFLASYEGYKEDYLNEKLQFDEQITRGGVIVYGVPLIKAMASFSPSSVGSDLKIFDSPISRYRMCCNCFYLSYKTDPTKPSQITYRHLEPMKEFFVDSLKNEFFYTSNILFDIYLRTIRGYAGALHLGITADLTEELLNRKGFVDALKQMCFSYDKIVIASIDIDYFKQVNDSKGHDEGDNVLKKAGEILRNAVDELNGIVARSGGEEFLAVFPANDTKSGSEIMKAFAEKINSKSGFHGISRERNAQDCNIKYRDHISASIGFGVLENCHELYEWFEKDKEDECEEKINIEINTKMINGIFEIVDGALYKVKNGVEYERIPCREQDKIIRSCRNGYAICKESELDDFVRQFMLNC